jgi:hypothetical protein
MTIAAILDNLTSRHEITLTETPDASGPVDGLHLPNMRAAALGFNTFHAPNPVLGVENSVQRCFLRPERLVAARWRP